MTPVQILHFKALVGAWYHLTRRKTPVGYSPLSPVVGVVFRRMIVVYQTAHGLTVDGTLNTETQKSLEPPDPNHAKRAKMVAYCQWAIDHHNSFIYDMARPIGNPSPSSLYGLPRRRDCSAFAKDAAYVAGFNDPSGYSFSSGYGNSYTMVDHCKHIPISALQQGDLIAFERPGHVVVVTGPHSTNPAGALWVASNGHQGAPDMTTLQNQIDGHSGYVIGLAISG